MNSKLLLLALVSSLAFSCARTNFYEHQILSTLPSTPTDGSLDIYQEPENQPADDYLEYYNLRVVRKGNYSDQQMLAILKAEAKKKGLDGITQIDHWQEYVEEISMANVFLSIIFLDDFEDNNVNKTYTYITGKGIKYLKNIDLSKSVKTGKIYDINSNTLVGEIQYLANGLISETITESEAYDALMDAYYNLSEDFLLRQELQWQTLHHSDGRVDVRRKYHENSSIMARVRVKYDPHFIKRIKSIRLTEFANGYKNHSSKIVYEYNDLNQLVKRTASGGYNLVEHISYEHGKVKETRLDYQGKSYCIVYDFYEQSDLNELIVKADEVKIEDNHPGK